MYIEPREFPGHPELNDGALCVIGLCFLLWSVQPYLFEWRGGLRSPVEDNDVPFWARAVIMVCGACIFLTGLLRFILMRLGF